MDAGGASAVNAVRVRQRKAAATVDRQGLVAEAVIDPCIECRAGIGIGHRARFRERGALHEASVPIEADAGGTVSAASTASTNHRVQDDAAAFGGRVYGAQLPHGHLSRAVEVGNWPV